MHSKAKSVASAGEAEDAGGKAGVGAVRGGAGEGHSDSDSASKTPCGLSPSHFRAASCPEAGVITEFRMGRNERRSEDKMKGGDPAFRTWGDPPGVRGAAQTGSPSAPSAGLATPTQAHSLRYLSCGQKGGVVLNLTESNLAG